MIQYSDFVSRDIVGICQSLLKSPDWHISPTTGKICPKNTGIDWQTPWVHIHRDVNRKCEYWMPLFKLTGIRPTRCFSCWKVVVRLSALSDLFKLHDFMKFDFGNPCKCGWDNRPYTSGVYAGYFYCDSKEIGLNVLEKVRAGLKGILEHDNSITLKRGCTEMEVKHKNTWDHSITDKLIEGMFNQNVHIPDGDQPQPEIVRIHVMRRWIENASRAGDETVKRHNGGNMLAPSLTNYEE